MRHLSVDIETYSDQDIKRVGLYRYAEDPSFDILLIAYSVDGGPVALVDLAQGDSCDVFWSLLSSPDVEVHAYNAVFEWWCLTTWAERQGRPLDRRELLRRTRCTMLQGMYCGYPAGLEAVGSALGLPEDRQKLATGRALIRTFCRPKRGGGRVLPSQEPEKWELFRAYCRQDVVTEKAVAEKLRDFPVPESEQRRWQTDALINARGVRVDLPLVEAAIAVDAEVTGALQQEAAELSGLSNPKSVQQLSGWLDSQGIQTDDLRKDTVKDLLAGEIDGDARRMLEIRQELAKASVKKYQAIQDAVGGDSRVRGLLQFYGTRTGRWAGRLVQVQNLPQNHLEALDLARELTRRRKTETLRLIWGAVPEVLSQLIRTAFVPSEGRRFIVADFAAIEARIIAWLAGEEWRQRVFAQGGDIYCASASQMFHVPVEKHGVNGHLRQKGKIAELALGYQGGAGALTAMGALKMGLTEEELPGIVSAWRQANQRIVKLWWEMEDAALECVRTCLPQVVAGRVQLEMAASGNKTYLLMRLPSGRCLYYPEPAILPNRKGRESLQFMGTEQATRKWGRQETYGGKLVENCVQAIARDCLAETIDRLEAGGYEIVMHVHDEVIIDATPEQKLEDVTAVMAVPMPWAAGLLLRGDGFEASYYKKD
ncbi:MAG: hypothetical protein IKD93_02405 [Firmicutes bacterium]|nr:hypothetical protein [Bacillota bacterium]